MIILELGPPPAAPLSTNEERKMGGRGSWARRNARLQPWKQLAQITALNARLAHTVDNTPCTVQVRIPFRTNQRRDPHNYVGTVVKAIVDGLIKAKVWPDDTPEWVTVLEPELVVDKTGRTPAAVILEARLVPARQVADVPAGGVL